MHYRLDSDLESAALLRGIWFDGTEAPGDKVFRIAVPLIKSSKKQGE